MVLVLRHIHQPRQPAMESVESFIREFQSESEFVTAHTSGSTGTPKEIHLKKSDMRASARATNAFFGINSESTLCCALSTEYIAGKMMAVRALEAQCRLVCLAPSRNLDFSPLGNCANLVAVVPAQVPSLLAEPDAALRFRNVLIGGAPLPADMRRELCRSGVTAWLSYGMTETCSHVALAEVSGSEPVYHAMPGITFATTPDGRLKIIAPDFSFGELTTNDIVELTDSHTFRWLGRADNVINSGGIKLHPEQLESEFARHLPGAVFYLTSEPHPLWGRALVMVLEGTEADAEAARAVLEGAIADRHCLPKRYIAIEKLSRTASMKIIRNLNLR